MYEELLKDVKGVHIHKQPADPRYDANFWLCAATLDPEVGDNVYRPLYEVASSKLARKTHVDMLNKVQINYYAAGLHREGAKAAFEEEEYRV